MQQNCIKDAERRFTPTTKKAAYGIPFLPFI
jgi:hypothetical protein